MHKFEALTRGLSANGDVALFRKGEDDPSIVVVKILYVVKNFRGVPLDLVFVQVEPGCDTDELAYELLQITSNRITLPDGVELFFEGEI